VNARNLVEHCKHKIFRARITYTEEPVDGSSPVEGIAPNGNPPRRTPARG
jgi:hypothetical protein